jgi:uncharacterized tellurite resistance protein B-like protein
MIVTLPDGKQNDAGMENFYSIAGINFGNVQSNEKAIINKINQITAEGWELHQVTSVYKALQTVMHKVYLLPDTCLKKKCNSVEAKEYL